jgi:hypothetical protein
MMGRTTMDVQAPSTRLSERESDKSGTTLPFDVMNRREFLSLQLFVCLNLSIGGLVPGDIFAWDDCTLWDDSLSWA